MKRILIRTLTAMKAALHLGPTQIFWYGLYQAGLRSGLFRRLSPVRAYHPLDTPLQPVFRLPDSHKVELLFQNNPGERQGILVEADEVCAGKARLFGGPPVELILQPAAPGPARHWTEYEGRPQAAGAEDFKFIWEPARFGWVYPLGRAYLLTGVEGYASAFWGHLDDFVKANPPNQGPNWASAQEVALRLLALLFARSVFEKSMKADPARHAQLAGIIAAHAERIPLTLSYARAQNNNHLISEALGLFAAGCALPKHPRSRYWKGLGARVLNRALLKQIRPDGVYAQHSTNYHRLVLHAALQAVLFGLPLAPAARQRLADATRWLLAQTDPISGRVPNLGANDGAHILPLACGGFADYRPVGQAASRAFLGQPAFPRGLWDELGIWLGQEVANPGSPAPSPAVYPLSTSPAVLRLGDNRSWATLRAARFHERPSHADQLHVDLWWDGENLAQDAGTYRYTASPPWDNSLAETPVHNTLIFNHQNQMQRAGRFLWLDWAQAKVFNTSRFHIQAVAAQHNGYQHLGVIHRRILKHPAANHWQVIDYLLPTPSLRFDLKRPKSYPCTVHWLLPDWPWELDGSALLVERPDGRRARLELSTSAQPQASRWTSLVRAGVALSGPKHVSPVFGWYSPAYAQKGPALSFSLTFQARLPVTIFSDWRLDFKE